MSNTAPTAAAPKTESKEKEAPAAAHPKAEKAESEHKPKKKAASDTDDSDSSDDSDDEKDPEKKAQKKAAKKAEKAKNGSAKGSAGGKPKNDAGSFARFQTVGRQEQRRLTLPNRKALLQETRPKQAYQCCWYVPLQHLTSSSLLHHLTTHHHYHIQSHPHPRDDGIHSHTPHCATNTLKTTQLHPSLHLPQSQSQPSSQCLPTQTPLLRRLFVKRLSPITQVRT